jgi:hypothetical protein
MMMMNLKKRKKKQRRETGVKNATARREQRSEPGPMDVMVGAATVQSMQGTRETASCVMHNTSRALCTQTKFQNRKAGQFFLRLLLSFLKKPTGGGSCDAFGRFALRGDGGGSPARFRPTDTGGSSNSSSPCAWLACCSPRACSRAGWLSAAERTRKKPHCIGSYSFVSSSTTDASATCACTVNNNKKRKTGAKEKNRQER